MRQNKQYFAGGAVMALAFAMTSPAQAQAQPQAATDTVSNAEIIVTANKREQSANSVGLTIQAASGDTLLQRGITGPADLSKLVPGFTFTQSIYSTPVYTLRGIGLYDATFGAAPSVSVYTDQIPRNVPVMSDALDLDVERVEVLKGPQGTLFGQSSTGGAVNYIMGKPTKDLHAGFNASYERFDRAEVGGFISGPLGDKVQARLAVKGISGGAWQNSLSRANDDNGDTRKLMGRLTVDLEPAPGVKIELTATGVKDRSDPLAPQYDGTLLNIYGSQAALTASGNPYGHVDAQRYADLTTAGGAGYDASFLGRQATLISRLNGADPVIAAGARAALGTPISNNARDAEWTPGLLGKSDNSYYQFSGRADIDLTDTITLTSVTALAKQKLNYAQDLDGTTAAVVDVPLFGDVKSFNQELRIAGNSDRVHWIIGGSYDNLKTSQNNYFRLKDYSANAGLIALTFNQFTSEMRSYGLFGNIEAEVIPNLTVQGGVRYTNNKQDASYCYNDPAEDTAQGAAFLFGQFLNFPAINIKPGECFPIDAAFHSSLTPVTGTQKEDNVSFRVGANYKFDQGTLIYATVSQGYKAGIFSAIGASSQSQYTPAVQEKVVAYEAGFKAPLMDRKVQLNAAVFYYDYSNKQVRGRIADTVFGLLEKMLNVPKSYIFGVEGELVMRPVEGLTLSGSASYLKTKVTSNYSATPDGQNVYNASGYTGNFYGSELPYTPKFSGNADVQYEFPLGASLNGFVGGTVTYQGKQNTTFLNAALPAVEFEIPGYATVDARIGVASPDGRWRGTIYGRNVTNKTYTTAISTFLDTLIRYRGKPAVYGASIAYRF
jgi:outer membrane receptor protein involved in Fe transport